MKTETAVTWLNSELERLSNQIGVNLSWAMVDDLIKDAKEKEKQQIIDAWNDWNTEAKFDDGIGCNANDYYAIKFNNCKD